MLFHYYEFGHAALCLARVARESCRLLLNPLNPLTHTLAGRSAIAACEVFERATRRYPRPAFGITRSKISDRSVRIEEKVVWQSAQTLRQLNRARATSRRYRWSVRNANCRDPDQVGAKLHGNREISGY